MKFYYQQQEEENPMIFTAFTLLKALALLEQRQNVFPLFYYIMIVIAHFPVIWDYCKGGNKTSCLCPL